MEALNNPGLNIASFNENPLAASKDGEEEVKPTNNHKKPEWKTTRSLNFKP